MPTRALKSVVCAVGLLMVTGCTTVTSGSAGPAPDAPATSTTTETSSSEPSSGDGDLPSDGAPSVTDPLDISRYVDDPCLALTTSQTQQLTLPQSGVLRDGALGKACRWSNSQSFLSVSANMLNKNPEGLSSFYRADKDGKWAYFEPLPSIEGYPAVVYDARDSRADGKCVVAVGVADDLAFDVSIQLASADVGTKDPCEAVVATATLMVRTMKAG